MFFHHSFPSGSSADDTLSTQISSDKQPTVFANLNLAVLIWGEVFRIDNNLVNSDSVEQSIATLFKKKGKSFIHSLDGHFTILIIDNREREIWCFNDRYNTVPVFFHYSKQTAQITISSRLEKIVEAARLDVVFNWSQVFSYEMEDNLEIAHPTFLRGVYLLEGGSYLRLKTEDFSLERNRYWSMEQVYLDSQADEIRWSKRKLVEEYRRLVTEAVLTRGGNSEELICLLSGGLDSSLVTALAGQMSKLPAYTICTVTSLANRELSRAIQVANEFASEHFVLPFSLTEKISPEDWWRTVWTLQSLSGGVESFIKNQLALEISRSSSGRFVLNGFGSDQLNGGTTTFDYSGGKFHKNWNEFHAALKNNVNRSAFEGNSFYEFAKHFFTPTSNAVAELLPRQDEWLTYLLRNRNGLLRKGGLVESQTSIQNGLVFRYPFLDNQLIDFTLRIPKAFHAELLFDKRILRLAFQDLLPKKHLNAPKFRAIPNVESAIYGFLKPIVYDEKMRLLDMVFEESKSLRSLFNKATLLNFVRHHKNSAYYPAFGNVLKIISIGLMDLGLSKGIVPASTYDVRFPSLASADWKKAIKQIKEEMKMERFRLNFDAPVCLKNGVGILKSTSDEAYFIVEGTKLLFRIDNPQVFRFLKIVDGEKTANQIIRQFSIEIEDLNETLELLFKEGIIFNRQVFLNEGTPSTAPATPAAPSPSDAPPF